MCSSSNKKNYKFLIPLISQHNGGICNLVIWRGTHSEHVNWICLHKVYTQSYLLVVNNWDAWGCFYITIIDISTHVLIKEKKICTALQAVHYNIFYTIKFHAFCSNEVLLYEQLLAGRPVPCLVHFLHVQLVRVVEICLTMAFYHPILPLLLGRLGLG